MPYTREDVQRTMQSMAALLKAKDPKAESHNRLLNAWNHLLKATEDEHRLSEAEIQALRHAAE